MSRRAPRVVLTLALLFLSGFAACLFIDNPDAQEATSSSSSAGGSGGGGGAGGASSTSDGAGGEPPSICERYGGYVAIETIVGDIVDAVFADCRIAGYFAGMPPETRKHMTGCMAKQMAILTKCPGIKYDTDEDGAACRDMKTSHAGLGVRQEDFDAFIEDVVVTLTAAGIAQTDLDALDPALSYLKKDIVTNSAPGLSKDGCGGGGG